MVLLVNFDDVFMTVQPHPEICRSRLWKPKYVEIRQACQSVLVRRKAPAWSLETRFGFVSFWRLKEDIIVMILLKSFSWVEFLNSTADMEKYCSELHAVL